MPYSVSLSKLQNESKFGVKFIEVDMITVPKYLGGPVKLK
jgi:hypothetical protein